ncbi:type II secretion system F family protein [Candidatus Peregrinibacteria bacterium]|nr:type II secretion system F family protein [Candidatus Peregrinibacteria bacterium]
MADEKKDFATMGTETFKIDGQSKDRVVLNIQEEKSTVVLDKSGLNEKKSSGNFFVDWYNKINNYFLAHSGVKVKEKATFLHLLSVMINSGIPMVMSLKSLVAQMDKSPRLQMIVKDLAEKIEAGDSLSSSMLQYGEIFTDAEIGMVESGEASGQLARVLENLAQDAEKAYSIKSKVKSAMIYPVVIFVLLILVVTGLMIFVIPKLTELFASAKGDLPLVTKIVVGLSNFMINNGIFILIGVAGIFVFFSVFKKTDTGKYALDKFKLSVPVFGNLFKEAYLARFARSLSNLLDSNISIVKTLEITANSMGNEVYRKRLMLAVEDIKQGIPLAENLTDSDLFPPMLVNMIDVGEKTAQLGEITAKVAIFYEDEVDTAVAGISKIIEPIILIVIGLTVGTVVAAVMLPIMKLSSLSSSL